MRFSREYDVILIGLVVLSYLLFHSEEIITMFLSSRDICDSSIFDTVKWLIPKLISRCNLLDDGTMQSVPKIEILIVLDLWIVSCCIAGFVFCRIKLQRVTDGDLTDYWYGAKCSKRNLEHSESFYKCGLVIAIAFVFVWSPAIDEGYAFGVVCLLSKYGLGAAFHGLFAVSPSYLVYMLAVSSRTKKKFSQDIDR